jgi:hypothetical protein
MPLDTASQSRMIATNQFRFSASTRRSATLGIVYLVGLLSGCGQQEQIQRYKAPRTAEPVRHEPETSAPARMLAAIVPHQDQAWFFKLTGAPDAAEAKGEEFQAFLKSISFSGGEAAKPTWQLPAEWRDEGGSGMRLATIRIGSGDESLELSVTTLPMSAGDLDEYCLANINRWRGQLQLPPIERAQLAAETTRLELPDDHTAVVVNMEGQLAANRPGAGPFMSGAGGGGPANRPATAPDRPADVADSELKYDAPKGWTVGKSGGLRKAAFEVQADDKRVEITIIDLAEAAGEVLPNVNRWRGQVKLENTTAAELKKEAKTIKVSGVDATYVELIGPETASPRQTILGVIAIHGGKSWFVKLQGDSELAAREKVHFEEFVKSVKF